LSILRPTLRCLCSGAFCQRAVEYTERPEGETPFQGEDDAYHRAYDACRVCGHFFAALTHDVTSFYEEGYVNATYGSLEGIREQFQKIVSHPPEQSDNHWRVRRVDGYWRRCGGVATKAPRLLDVGCGLAVFPFRMRQAGWECTVIDPDQRAVDHAANDLGIKALTGDFSGVSSEDLGRYDAITFNKVLEHIEDPVPLLEKAAEHLQPEGVVYVEVPDTRAQEDPLGFGREEFFIDHLHVFSAASLCHLVEMSGLRVSHLSRFREPSGKYTLAVFCSREQVIGGGAAVGGELLCRC